MNNRNKFLGLAAMVLALITGVAKADFLPVCSRTPQVQKFLTAALQKTCDSITQSDLLTLTRVAVDDGTVTEFKADDFSGLGNLETLNIRNNKFVELPEGLFKDLVNLKTLVIINTTLRHYPDDFLQYNPKMVNLHTFRNQVRSISESVFTRLESMQDLQVLNYDKALGDAEKARLNRDFPSAGKVQLFFH